MEVILKQRMKVILKQRMKDHVVEFWEKTQDEEIQKLLPFSISWWRRFPYNKFLHKYHFYNILLYNDYY
ncbi:hypothetical protein [Sporanaerobacter acetigenes]|uniref:hypothetical protein n=1 Tax=Sporanaerobacter acetigenes TaxID=165813 RepID=UPI00332643E2